MSKQTIDELESAEQFAARLKLPFENNRLLLLRALTHRSYINEHPEALEDNERLEFLGDAVLDFLVGAYLYHHFPEMPEGDLTRMRSALVHTGRLASFAQEINLGNALRLGHGEEHAGGRTRLPILCDAFEALVGAIYLSAGMDGVSTFIYPLLEPASAEIINGHRLDDPKSQLQEWSQARGYATPTYITSAVNGPDHDKTFEVEVYINNNLFGTGMGRSKQQAAKLAAKEAISKIDSEHIH